MTCHRHRAPPARPTGRGPASGVPRIPRPRRTCAERSGREAADVRRRCGALHARPRRLAVRRALFKLGEFRPLHRSCSASNAPSGPSAAARPCLPHRCLGEQRCSRAACLRPRSACACRAARSGVPEQPSASSRGWAPPGQPAVGIRRSAAAAALQCSLEQSEAAPRREPCHAATRARRREQGPWPRGRAPCDGSCARLAARLGLATNGHCAPRRLDGCVARARLPHCAACACTAAGPGYGDGARLQWRGCALLAGLWWMWYGSAKQCYLGRTVHRQWAGLCWRGYDGCAW
jgi:hypothetical protein